MAHLTYDGSARDHEVIPQVLKTGGDGKPMKRRVKVPAQTIFKPLEVYNLMGMRFPKGQTLEVADRDAIKKASTVGCFDVEIAEGEPISYDKKWLEKALQGPRVKMAKGLKEAPAAQAIETKAPQYASDGLDGMKRTELMRLANSRGLTVHVAMKKETIIAMLREQAAPAEAEAASELDYNHMTDVG